MWESLTEKIKERDFKAIARAISYAENETAGYENLLENLSFGDAPVIGITGAPGSGKSTITDALIGEYISINKKVAVICVDPSSPFNMGAVLGDRIRMNDWHSHPDVYIRSIGSRGSLGGLSSKIIEATDILRAANFDIILIETVGIGQSEIDIAGLADITVLVLVPESGDEIQFMKSGVMEVADVFVINKSDRPGADTLEKNLQAMLHSTSRNMPPVVKTIASLKTGVSTLRENINEVSKNNQHRRSFMLAEKIYQLISRKRMKDITKEELVKKIEKEGEGMNIYRFIKQF